MINSYIRDKEANIRRELVKLLYKLMKWSILHANFLQFTDIL